MNDQEIEQIYKEGVKYYKGEGVPVDLVKAQKYFKKSADKGHVEAMFLYAQINEDKDINDPKLYDLNLKEMIKYYKMAAEKGHIPSIRRYLCIREDDDRIEDKKYLKILADNGDEDDILEYVAKMYEDEIDCDPDELEEYCKKGIDLGIQKCMYIYAKIFYDKDLDISAHYFKISADDGYKKSMYEYGLMLRDGIGIPVDKKEAYNYFLRAHELGHRDSCLLAAQMLIYGNGVEVNFEKAIELLSQPLNEGYENMFLHFLLGSALARVSDENMRKKAFYHLKKSAADDYVYAMTQMGILYLNGIGTPVDRKKALECFLKGVDGGDGDAMAYAGFMYMNGMEVTKDIEKALEYFKKGSDLGNLNAKNYYEECLKMKQNVS